MFQKLPGIAGPHSFAVFRYQNLPMEMSDSSPYLFEDKSSVAYGVVAFLLLLSGLIVFLRLWTRATIHQWGVDDWTALLALVGFHVCRVLTIGS